MEEPYIAPSAYRHGVDAEVILHAFRNPIHVEELDDGMVMLIGVDHAGNPYEIGAIATDDGPVILHAMPARPKYLR